MIRRTIYFTGRVQGVGFRYTTAAVAKSHDVAGTVQNLDDGRVKLVAEGAEPAVAGFVKDLRQRMRANIKAEDVHDAPATGEFGRPGDAGVFSIIR